MTLDEALFAAHAEMKNPKFDSKNPHFSSDYASLEAVLDAVMPIYRKHGILVTQHPYADEKRAGVSTRYVLSVEPESPDEDDPPSKEVLSFDLYLPLEKPNAHGVGSCITYARRYALLAFAGLVGEADDDGNAAVAQPVKTPAPPQTPAAKVYGGTLGWFWNELNDHKARLGSAFYPIVNAGVALGKMTTDDQRKALLAKLAAVK